MASAPNSPSKFEDLHKLRREIASVRSMNANLNMYLEQLRMFKMFLPPVHENLEQVPKVNNQWVEMLPKNRYEPDKAKM